mmetsp:Transcript_77439/g.153763  ORF Transcript_77439/g.153763 Transcript_77439/m.153763 type:complete len:86 (+) Transcript_77439:82-339(+)
MSYRRSKYAGSRQHYLRKRVPGDLSVEDVEDQLKRIKAAKLSKAKVGRGRAKQKHRPLAQTALRPGPPHLHWRSVHGGRRILTRS